MFELDNTHVSFMESGVSIMVASRSAENRPLLGRGMGCRVSPADGRVTVFLSRQKYPFLLDALRRSRSIAVSFTEPSTNESIQVKGTDAELVGGEPGDTDRIATYMDLFVADLRRINVRGELAHAVHGGASAGLAAVAFTPSCAFVQTPGAKAGNRIGA